MAYLWNSILNHDGRNCTLCNNDQSGSIEGDSSTDNYPQSGLWNSLLNHNTDSCSICKKDSKTSFHHIQRKSAKTKKSNLSRSKIAEILKAQIIRVMGKSIVNQKDIIKQVQPKPTVKLEHVGSEYIDELMKTAVVSPNDKSEIPLLSFSSTILDNQGDELKAGTSSGCSETRIDTENILCTAPVTLPIERDFAASTESTDDENDDNNEPMEHVSGQEIEEQSMTSMAVLNCHECDKCQRQFVDWKEYKFHKELCGLVYPFLCQSCGHTVPNESGYLFHLNYHKKLTSDYMCGHCNGAFSTDGALRNHLKQKKPCKDVHFLCKSCGLMCTHSAEYEAHYASCTKRRTNFVCSICGDELGRKASLDRHIKLVHEKEKFKNDFCCDACGKTFGDRSALKKHMMKHAERKYKCFECGRKFIYIGNLQTHMKIHIREMNLNPLSNLTPLA